MENLPINPVDGIVLAVIVLAALLAFTRGMVAEVLSVVAWAGAAVLALYALPFVLPVVHQTIKFEMLAYAISAAGVFAVTLVVLTMLFGRLSKRVQASSLSALDRTLGFVFGLAKGALLVSIAYLFFTWLVPPTEHPQWLKEAKTQPLLAAGAETLLQFVPPNLRAEGMARAAPQRPVVDPKEQLDRLTTPVPAPPKNDAPPADTGYKDRERGELNRLIQNAR